MTKRIQRLNQLIKEEFGKILLREGDFPKEIFVTLTRVETSIDLREARIWISVFPEKKAKEILQILNKRIYDFQQKLNKTLKIKFVPKIRFLVETEIKEAAKIEELLQKIENEKEK